MTKKGYWAPRVDAIFMMGKTPYHVDKAIRSYDRKGKGKNKLYFIPEEECTQEYRAKHIPEILEDKKDEILAELEANVDFNDSSTEYGVSAEDLNNDLKRAKKERAI